MMNLWKCILIIGNPKNSDKKMMILSFIEHHTSARYGSIGYGSLDTISYRPRYGSISYGSLDTISYRPSCHFGSMTFAPATIAPVQYLHAKPNIKFAQE